jgi:hypothetical protein
LRHGIHLILLEPIAKPIPVHCAGILPLAPAATACANPKGLFWFGEGMSGFLEYNRSFPIVVVINIYKRRSGGKMRGLSRAADTCGGRNLGSGFCLRLSPSSERGDYIVKNRRRSGFAYPDL